MERHPFKGRLIVIEGVDGCGKDTQVEMLVKRLKKEYPSRIIVDTFEPWESKLCPSGSRIKRILRKEEYEIDPGDGKVDPCNFQTMYVEARYIHWVKEIIPALEKGAIIICNRERLSTYAYGSLQGVSMASIFSWHMLIPEPDLTLLIDISVKTSLERLSKRPGTSEYFEKEEWLERLVAIYRTLVESDEWPGDLKIDGEGSIKEVHENIYNACKDLIRES